MNEIIINNRILKYDIVIKNIKRTYFRIKNDYVLITTNQYFKKIDIINFLEANASKFFKLIDDINSEKPFTLWGQKYEIRHLNSPKFRYQIVDNIIYVYSSKSDEEAIKQLLKKEIIIKYESLRNEISDTIKHLGLTLVKTHFKFLKSRYGSCNIKKNEITINTFLARIDALYLKYVIYHEYAHLIVPNHQKDFYQVLDQFMINHKEIQKRLKKIAIY